MGRFFRAKMADNLKMFGLPVPNEEEETKPENGKQSYACPKEGCSKEFSRQSYLDDHLLLGTCSFDPKYNLTDLSKVLYGQKLEDNRLRICPTISTRTNVTADGNGPDIGWALKQKKKTTQFTPEQKEFMFNKFSIGKKTGSKIDPYLAAEEMRSCGKFQRKHFLTGKQIASHFSRLSREDRKMDKFDFKAAKEETNRTEVKNEILSVLQTK